jgi:threonine dehydratase
VGPLVVTDPVPEFLARIAELVDEVLLVDDEDMRAAMALIAKSMGLVVEAAGAAGVAALARHPEALGGQRVAVLLTGEAA